MKKATALLLAVFLIAANCCPVYASCDSQTVLMLHLNGTDGSTTIPDSSDSNHTMTCVNSAALSTTSPKFGTAALLLNGSTDSVTTPTSTDFDFSGDFTIDCWVKMAVTGGDQCVYDRNVNQCFISFTGTNTIWVGINGAQSSTFAVTEDTTTWHHLAWVRSGSTNTVYWDGTSLGTYTNSGSISEVTQACIGKRDNSTWFFNGRIDEFRISKGIARWTTNFTPPTTEYCASTTSPSNLACQGVG